MAHAVEFPGANKVYGPPPGRDDVAPRHHVFANGTCIVACWELTDAELEEVIRTRRVFVSSMSGDTLFPMFVGSESVVRSVVVDYGKLW